MNFIEWNHENEDGEKITEKIPAIWSICDTCRGNGKHSRHLGAITESDREQHWSEDEFEGYMRGEYDMQCEVCKGTGKVLEPEWSYNAEFSSWRGGADDLEKRYKSFKEDQEAWEHEDANTMFHETGGMMGSRY